MGNVVVIGSQWGDEGKGKIVDWLSKRADVVVRFQGGHNAGHTLVIDEQVYKLHLLPSGIVRKGKISIIGNGVVVDPWALMEEIETVSAQGVEITPENLMVAENVNLILPVHQAVDHALEKSRGKRQLGTTGRGIGPTYEDKAARRGVRLADLEDENILSDKLERLMIHHNALLKGLGAEMLDPVKIADDLKAVGEKILPYAKPVWRELDTFRKEGRTVLFEGAQGVMLDVDHGTYPYVTSSNTVAAQAAAGSGVGPRQINYVLGITKAYTTRVGTGPFPTELDDEIGQRLGEKGREFGTTTGRKRRCGWFDAVCVRQAVKQSGIEGIALTKLDVLDGMEKLQICTAYEIDGQRYDYLPASVRAQHKAVPVYEEFDGWSESTHGVRRWSDLPASAIKYIRMIEELIETPVTLLSTSPEREDTILMEDPFLS